MLEKYKSNMNQVKLLIFTVSFMAFIYLSSGISYAIGDFSLGINTGLTYDPNNLESRINRANQLIRYSVENTAGSEGEEIDIPYAFAYGCNLKYQFNYLLFRLSGYFVKPGAGVEGSFTPPGGPENKIRVMTYQASLPLTFAFLMPLKERTLFYFGGGITYHIASIKITQSNPDPAYPVMSTTNRMDKYTGDFTGWHLLFGAEVPVMNKYSVSVEWIHQEGRSHPISNDGIDINGNRTTAEKQQINTRGDFIFFGVNYYISI